MRRRITGALAGGDGAAAALPGDPRQTAVVLVVAGAGVVAALIATALRVGGPAGVLAGVVLVCLAGAPLLLRLREDHLDAPGLYGAVFVTTFGLTALAWLGTPPSPGPGLDQDVVARALILAAAGLGAFTAGSIWVAGAVSAPQVRPITQPPSVRVLAAAYCVAVAAILVGVAFGAYGYLATEAGADRLGSLAGAVPFVGGLTSVVILATAVAWLQTGEAALRKALVGMLCVQVPLGFVIGVKGESVIPLVLVALAMVAVERRLPWKAIAIAAVVVFLVLVPANESYREEIRAQDDPTVFDRVRAVADPGNYRPDRTIPEAPDYFFRRFRNIDHVALIQRDTPSAYRYGDGSNYYLLPLIAAVPRRLWDDKPTIDTSAQFSRTYWEIRPSIKTSQPLTQAGDLYRNFAWPGVLVGLLLWGCAIGIWQRVRRTFASPRTTAVYLWSLPTTVLYVESDLPHLIATFAKALPLVVVVAWLLLPGADAPPGYRQLGGWMRRVPRLGQRATSL